MQASTNDNSALALQTSVWPYTTRTNINVSRKAGKSDVETERDLMIEARGIIIT
jgi:hypothetical protein